MESVTKEELDAQKESNFTMEPDDPQNTKVVTLTVPIRHLAMASSGTALLRGQLDEFKQKMLLLIQAIRQKEQSRGGIIRPGAPRVN